MATFKERAAHSVENKFSLRFYSLTIIIMVIGETIGKLIT